MLKPTLGAKLFEEFSEGEPWQQQFHDFTRIVAYLQGSNRSAFVAWNDKYDESYFYVFHSREATTQLFGYWDGWDTRPYLIHTFGKTEVSDLPGYNIRNPLRDILAAIEARAEALIASDELATFEDTVPRGILDKESGLLYTPGGRILKVRTRTTT